MELSEIYHLVAGDLNRVGAMITSIADVSFPRHREMLEHCLTSGGKRVRPALNLLAGQVFNYNVEQLLPMAASIEMMHIATLVHDDAIDRSLVRRNRDTVYRLWGEEMAILLGDFLFAKAGEMCTNTGSLLAVSRFTQTLQIISTGEIIQANSAFNLEQHHEDYIQRIAYKTASLFALSTETGAILSDAPESAVKALRDYGYNMGVAFQLVDDVLDYTSTKEEMGKPIASDLNQGTLTLPAMLLLERYPENNPIRELFANHAVLNDTEKRDLTQRAVTMARESNITEDCLRLAVDYSDRAIENLDELPEGTARKALEDLALYLITRRT